MAERFAAADYDQPHHFMADGVWGATPLETELLNQADRLVGGDDAVLIIDDTAVPEEGRTLSRCRGSICLGSWQNGKLPNIGVSDASARRSAGDDRIASLPTRELDEGCRALMAPFRRRLFRFLIRQQLQKHFPLRFTVRLGETFLE